MVILTIGTRITVIATRTTGISARTRTVSIAAPTTLLPRGTAMPIMNARTGGIAKTTPAHRNRPPRGTTLTLPQGVVRVQLAAAAS